MPLTVVASPCSFSKKNGLIMALDQNPHQTVTRFGCVRMFCVPNAAILLVYIPPRSKWASSEKMILFGKIGIFCKSIAGPLSEAKTHWMLNWLQLQLTSYQGMQTNVISYGETQTKLSFRGSSSARVKVTFHLPSPFAYVKDTWRMIKLRILAMN